MLTGGRGPTMSIILDSESPKLFSLLASIPGKKTLILDQSLSILISSLASFTQLQDHGIESVKWLLQTDSVDVGPVRVLIICRSDVDSIRRVASIVKKSQGKEFTLLLAPRKTLQTEEILEKEGIYADIDVRTLPISHTQEDGDIIRVDVPPAPDSSPLVSPAEIFQIAKTLLDLQKQYGQLNRIRGKGNNVPTLTSILTQLEADLLVEEKTALESGGLLGECIVLDRATDSITPFLTQLTYEGLLYESYPVAGCVLELPSQITTPERKITLGPEDVIFTDLRGESFSNVGPKLSGTASTLSSELDSRHGMKTTTQLKQFVSRIPNLQSSQKSLRVHIELTELLLAKTKSISFRRVLEIEQSLYGGFPETDIMAQMESLIAIGESSVPATLRLLCLWSLVHNGLKGRDFDAITQKLIHAHGAGISLSLHRLTHLGLFLVRSAATERGRGGWTGFARTWRLTPEETVDEKTPADVSYLYSGYAPLNLRILEGFLAPERFDVAENAALKVLSSGVAGVGALGGGGGGGSGNSSAAGSNRQIDSMLRNLRGAKVDEKRISHDGRRGGNGGGGNGDESTSRADGRVTVVVFLGGCCATELAGVRFLMNKMGRECLILTKGMIDGTSLMRELVVDVKIS